MEIFDSQVVKDLEGYLFKKSRHGLGKLRPWQKRYFILKVEERSLYYYKNGVESVIKGDVLGKIPLSSIEDICLFLDKGKGCRFDLITRDNETSKKYELKAIYADAATQWTQKIAMVAGRDGTDPFLKSFTHEQKTEEREWVKNIRRKSLITFQAGEHSHSQMTPLQAHLISLLISSYRVQNILRSESTQIHPESPMDEDLDTLSVDSAESDLSENIQTANLHVNPIPSVDVQSRRLSDLWTNGESQIPILVLQLGSSAKVLYFLWYNMIRIIETQYECKLKVSDSWMRPISRNRRIKSNFCPVEGCQGTRVDQNIYCEEHLKFFDLGDWLLLDPQQQSFITELFFKASLDAKLQFFAFVFSSDDTLAQSLALHLLWISLLDENITPRASARFSLPSISNDVELSSRVVARKRLPQEITRMETFSRFVTKYCSGANFSPYIRDSLLSIVCPRSFIFNVGDLEIREPTFGEPHNFEAWKCLFCVLKDSNMILRVECLEDINMMLLEDDKLKRWILKQSNWQKWIIDIIYDITKTSEEDESYSCDDDIRALKLSLNIFTLLHHYAFFVEIDQDQIDLSRILYSSLKTIRMCSNCKLPTRSIARLVLSSLLSKLHNSKGYFPSDLTATSWINLFVLTSLVKRFVFFTPQWTCAINSLSEDQVEPANSVDGGSTRSGRSSFSSRKRSSSRGKSLNQVDLLPIAAAFIAQEEAKAFGTLEESSAIVHYDMKGIPEDKELIFKSMKLLRSLKMTDCEISSNYGNMRALNDNFVEKIQREIEFFVDASELLEALKYINRTNVSTATENEKCIDRFCKAKTAKERSKVLAALSKS